jgi:hypothetical protein
MRMRATPFTIAPGSTTRWLSRYPSPRPLCSRMLTAPAIISLSSEALISGELGCLAPPDRAAINIASLARGSQALPTDRVSDREFTAIPIQLKQQLVSDVSVRAEAVAIFPTAAEQISVGKSILI